MAKGQGHRSSQMDKNWPKLNKKAKPDRYISNSKSLKLPVFVKFDAFCYKIAKQQPSRLQALWLLNSSLWLYSSFVCYTAAFGCLHALQVKQQPLAAFKFRLLYSSLWMPSCCACYTAAFGCLLVLFVQQVAFKLYSVYSSLWLFQAFLVIRQPLAVSKFCLLCCSLWLPSSFAS